jgi:hypothetical protein
MIGLELDHIFSWGKKYIFSELNVETKLKQKHQRRSNQEPTRTIIAK